MNRLTFLIIYYISVIIIVLFSLIYYFTETIGYGILYHVTLHYIFSLIFIFLWGVLNSFKKDKIANIVSIICIIVLSLSMIIITFFSHDYFISK